MLHKSGAKKKRRRTRSERKVQQKPKGSNAQWPPYNIVLPETILPELSYYMPHAMAQYRCHGSFAVQLENALGAYSRLACQKKQVGPVAWNVSCPFLSGGGQFAPFLWGQSAFCGKYFSLHIIEITTIGAVEYWLVLAAFNCFHFCKSIHSGRQSESAQINNCHICSSKSIGWLLFVFF